MLLRTGLVVFAFVLSAQVSLNAQQGTVTKTATQHQHAAHGPHHGELLEIGKEEYHAEIVVDETKKYLTLYLLDSHAKSYVAIDAPFVGVNLKLAGKPAQLKLKPVPQEFDKPGFASRFGLESSPLLDAFHGGHADAKLALKIGGKAYSVKLEHQHDHAGHTHAPAVKK